MGDDFNNWTKVQLLKNGKRYHTNSSEQNSPRTSVNKNKKFFFSANRYEVLSQNDHETMLPMIDTTHANNKNHACRKTCPNRRPNCTGRKNVEPANAHDGGRKRIWDIRVDCPVNTLQGVRSDIKV
ncbi:hypothetical protein QTP88_021988 [Uroleucon formosanum]